MSEVNLLAEAVRAEIRKKLETEPFGIGVLAAVERLAKAGSAMLRASGDMPFSLGEGPDPSDAPSLGYSGLAIGGYGGGPETFGTKMLKEVIDALPELLDRRNSSPEKLVEAIANAKANGLNDIAEALTKKLVGRDLGAKPAPETIDVDAPELKSENFPHVVEALRGA